MSSFNLTEPLISRKPTHLDFQDRQGLWRIHWQVGDATLLSRFYTRIDQVFILWGAIAAMIFMTAQFAPVSWATQAIFWSVLTVIGVIGMTALAWFWVSVERLRWVVYCWAGLMLAGMLLTDLSIFLSWWRVLIYLCPLWLGLSAAGYLITGIGMRSRALALAGGMHLAGMAILPHVTGWQFLATGLIMASSLLFLAEMQWDMRPPINFSVLSEEQKQFNREQHRLRQMTAQRQCTC